MKLHLKWLLPLLATLLIVALAVRGVTQRRAEQARAAAPRAPVALELAPSDVVTAARLEVVRTLEVSGTIEAVRTAMVKAKVAGEVRELHVREGDAVRAGQVVATLDATEYAARLRQAQQQAESARAQLEIAERTLQNNRALVEQGFISRNALDTSVSNAAAARANLLAAQAAADVARKAMDDAVLRAPIAGSVSQRLVQPGERVGVDGRIVEIVDLRELELEAAVPPDQVGAVRVGAKATLRVDGVDAAVTARVARINPSTQAGTRAVPVYLARRPTRACATDSSRPGASSSTGKPASPCRRARCGWTRRARTCCSCRVNRSCAVLSNSARAARWAGAPCASCAAGWPRATGCWPARWASCAKARA